MQSTPPAAQIQSLAFGFGPRANPPGIEWFHRRLKASALHPAVALAFVLFAATGANGQGYTFTQVTYPQSNGTFLTAVNDSNVAVGYYQLVDQGPYYAFSYQNGNFTPIVGPLTGQSIQPIAINNAGQVLIIEGSQYFVYSGGSGGTFSPIGLKGVVTATGQTFTLGSITGFNDVGQVVGAYSGNVVYGIPAIGPPGTTTPPTTNGSYTQFDCPAGTSGLESIGAINNSAQITGSCLINGVYGFIYSGGSTTLFYYPASFFPGSPEYDTTGIGISNSGIISGAYEYTDGPPSFQGIIYNGSQFTLVVPPGAAAGTSMATGVNSSGTVVGWYTATPGNGGYTGFITSTSEATLQPGQLLGAGQCPVCSSLPNAGPNTALPITYPSAQPATSTAADASQSVAPLGNVSAGRPIDVASGNMFYGATDYTTAGQNPLAFTRAYNSRNTTGLTTLAVSLGVDWRSNYDRYLQLSPTSVIAERADGQQLTFTLNAGLWIPYSDVDVTLTNAGSTWTLKDHYDTVETYSAISSTEALLQTVQARNGYTQTLHYNANNQLTSVTDVYNRSMTLTYNGNGTLNTISTPDNTTLTYGYTAGGGRQNLTSVTYPTSPSSVITFVYNNPLLPNALTEVIDENGNQYLTWTYDAYARGTSSQVGTGPNAQITNISYDDSTGGRTVTNPLTVVDSYTFVPTQGGVPKVTQISRAMTATTAAMTRSFAYDANGYMASQTDWNGNVTTYVNDSHGDPTSINEAVGTSITRMTTIAYDPTFVHLPSTIVTQGLTTSFVYDPNENLLTETLKDTTTTTQPYVTNGETRTWTYTWQSFLLASAQTPNGNLTKYGYDATGALISTTNPLTQVTNITSHTGGGYPLTIVDPNIVTTTLTYNARQWLLTSTVSATGQPAYTTTWGYDPAGNLTSLTLPDNSRLTYGYDTAHRLISTTDLFGNNIASTLDALGDVTLTNVSNPSGTIERTHSDIFDYLGRVLQDIGGASQTTIYTYDNNGNALTITDPDTNLTQQSFDALNRVSTVTYPSPGGTATMSYDEHNRVLTVTYPKGHTTSYVYDGFGDAILQASPDSGKTVYRYDGDSNLTRKTDATGAITANTYDALDRVRTTTYPNDASENVTFVYDQAGHGFGIGHLTSLKDAVGSLSRGYDERGNMLTESRTSGANTLKTVYSYDPASRIASITYPSTAIVAYTRDIMGRIITASAEAPGATTYSSIASAIAYEPFGPVTGFTFGNGVTDARTYDPDYRLTSISDVGTATYPVYLAYSYDPANNLTYIEDLVTFADTQNLTYDPLNRLKTASSLKGGYGSLKWTYDEVGNRQTQTANKVLTTYGYASGTSRLSTITTGTTTQTVGTTASGNINSFSPAMNSITALSYNQANRLATVMAGTAIAATYTYDGFGQRLVKTPLGISPILYQFDQGGNLLEEGYGSSTGPVDYIYVGTQPVATLATGAFSYLHTDHLGTPLLATSGTQAVVWSAGDYQPFGTTGTVTGTITQNLRLPGQYFDAESAFYHNGFRDYMPNLGRYLESDPVGLVGGLDTYLYGNANPGVFTDPDGTTSLTPEDIFNPDGTISEQGVQNSRMIIPNSQLNNPEIPAGFNKYSTQTYSTSSGKYQTHFYRNPSTGEMCPNLDYKTYPSGKGPNPLRPGSITPGDVAASAEAGFVATDEAALGSWLAALWILFGPSPAY